MANKTFNLDLSKDIKTNPVVYGRVGDGGLQTITVNISNQNVPVDLTGFIITFEGVTNSDKSKIFDSQGVSSTEEGLKKGTFDYIFPSAAFGVSGRYERAYFSFQKETDRTTTGQIDVIVSDNADIDAQEAETIITEYNKLVQELHEITDKYISDSDAKFADLNQQIADLQSKIDDYTTTVKGAADDAVAVVNAALAEFQAADFYTKSEMDTKLSEKADDSAVVHNTTDETITGNKTFSGNTGVGNFSITGDFTERTVTATLIGIYNLTFTLRRTGNIVELISTRTTVGSATAHEQIDSGVVFPSGYRPISRALVEFNMNNGSTLYNPMILRIDSTGISYITNEAFSGNRATQGYQMWVTNDPWPETN